MRDRIHSARPRDMRGQSQRELRIVDHNVGQDAHIPASMLLASAGHPPDRGHLRTCVGRRNGHEAEIVGEDHGLAQTGSGASAKGEHRVRARLQRRAASLFCAVFGNVLGDPGAAPHDPIAEELRELFDVGLLLGRVKQENAFGLQLIEFLGHASPGARPEYHPPRQGGVNEGILLHHRPRRLARNSQARSVERVQVLTRTPMMPPPALDSFEGYRRKLARLVLPDPIHELPVTLARCPRISTS